MGVQAFLWLASDRLLASLSDEGSDVVGVCYRAYDDDGLAGECFLDLGKDWGILHFLLTGTALTGDPPLNFIASGGRWIRGSTGDGDVQNIRAFGEGSLREIDAALQRVGRKGVASRFDVAEMDRLGVYRGRGWARGAVVPPYILERLDSVRALVRTGVERRLGMLAWQE